MWQTYNETLLRAKNFGSGLICQGLNPGQNTFVGKFIESKFLFDKTFKIFICTINILFSLFFTGIYAQNCPEWILTEQAAYCYSMVIVPLYDTLGANACAFIVNQSMYFLNSFVIS